MKIRLSTGNSRTDKRWNLAEMELDEFRDRISATRRTAETVEQYKKLSKARQDDIKDVGGFVLGTLKGGRRKKDCVLTRSGLCLDMDYALPDIIEQIEMFCSFKCCFTPPISIRRKSLAYALLSRLPARCRRMSTLQWQGK